MIDFIRLCTEETVNSSTAASIPSVTDWIMVIVTVVYVIATIFIFIANHKSAKVSKEQLEESKRQFDSINKPLISVEIVQLRRVFYALRFSNFGNQPALDFKISLDETFINSINDTNIKSLLEKNNNRLQTLNCNGVYDLYYGNEKYLQSEKVLISGEYSYRDKYGNKYKEHFEFDPLEYATFFTTNTETDDIIKAINEETKAIKEIRNSLNSLTEAIKEQSAVNIPKRTNETFRRQYLRQINNVSRKINNIDKSISIIKHDIGNDTDK